MSSPPGSGSKKRAREPATPACYHHPRALPPPLTPQSPLLAGADCRAARAAWSRRRRAGDAVVPTHPQFEAALRAVFRVTLALKLEDASYMLAAQILARALAALHLPPRTERGAFLVAAVSLDFACKVTEVNHPSLSELGNGTFDAHAMAVCEKEVWRALDYCVIGATPLDFLARDSPDYAAARALCFLSTCVPELYAHPPDVVGAACHALAAGAAPDTDDACIAALRRALGDPPAHMRAVFDSVLPRA
jgi:Cyclin, N-terminal domain